jgi:ribosome-binding protein aMBF1 (putative translation factor)
MIRTDTEYQRALKRLATDKSYLNELRKSMAAEGLTVDEVERAMQPALSFHAQLEEEVEIFERMKRGDLDTLHSLTSIGRWLIGARLAKGWSQKQLAEHLGVSEAQVSRDESNEYHNVTVERAQRILEVMGVRFRMEVEGSVIRTEQEEGLTST